MYVRILNANYIYYKNSLEGNNNVTQMNNYVIKINILKGLNEYIVINYLINL